MDEALQLVADGVVVAAALAVAAVGLSLIMSVLRMINVAHGDLLTVAAFAALVCVNAGLPLVIALIVAAVASALIALGLELSLWRRMRARGGSNFSLLLLSVGLAYVVRHVLFLIFGEETHQYAPPTRELAIGPVYMTREGLTVVAGGAVCMIGLAALLKWTRIGTAMRAMADNMDLARASGVDVARTSAITWVIVGVLTGVGGVLLGIGGRIFPNMGWNIILLVFAAVVLGGIGTAAGAAVGSLVIGVGQELVTHSALGLPPEMKQAFVFLFLVVALVIRPQGLFGARRYV
ncbi:branched-chain amino acid ABC transporter permease [Phytoactinopolyspora limicola]|uniref:branched-chain amino acid ABC transporter permease n=1 Tax=Phytoactinopolyspora limicola TaxID=2715536 RepID=UPI00140771EB|nr:branched-chain amino acid ABC transporter permease [Phytoactinopolyspora limicola]